MPTPMEVFVQMAVKYGNVDPTDEEAVDRFFEEELPKLPERQQLEIVETLLAEA